MRDHLATFLAHARETYSAPLPRYVQDELRGYLCCGVFAPGFVRAHGDTCGHDLLVAFSCKGRGVCPSCAGRRMANTAAHVVDRVLEMASLMAKKATFVHFASYSAAEKPLAAK